MSKALLIIEDPEKRLFRCTLDDDLTLIGREYTCSVVFPDKSVSRKHLNIKKAAAGYTVQALSEGNPVIVVSNSEDVDILSAQSTQEERRILRHRDILKVGKYNLHCWFETDQPLFRTQVIKDLPWFSGGDGIEQDPDSTSILTPEQTRQLLQSDRIFANATIEGETKSWSLGQEGVTFGRQGEIEISGWRSAKIVAEIRWENGVHHLVPKGGWLAIRINQYTIREQTELRDEDIVFIGAQRFIYRVQSGL